MILFTIDFQKPPDSVLHPTLFHKLISAGFSSCFTRWTQSFFSDRYASVVHQNHKSHSFRVRLDVPRGSVLGAVLFSLFINDFPAALPSSVSFSLYADYLVIWSSFPSVPAVVEATQGALFRLERWSEYWCLISIRANVRALSFQCISTKLTSFPTSSYSAPASVSLPLQLFLGSPSTALFPFLNMYLRCRPSSSHVSRPYAVTLLSHRASLRSHSLLCIKLFFGPTLLKLHPHGFLS